MAFHREKFKTLIHYICWKVQNPLALGATKLNKVLWYSDLLAFLNFGHAVAGAKFIKREFGPVPPAVIPLLDELQSDGSIAIRETNYRGKPKRDFFALREPDLNAFSQKEIALVDDVIVAVCMKHTAKSISDLTHNDAWEMAEIGEEMPLFTAFSARKAEIDEDDVVWADSQIAELPVV